jgi:hypothetical protein
MTNPNEGKQEELFSAEHYDVSEDITLFENVDMGALGEVLEARDAKLLGFLEKQLERVGGKDVGLESLIRRARNGTLALEIELAKIKRNLPK